VKVSVGAGLRAIYPEVGSIPASRTIFPKLQPLGVDRQVRKAVLTSTTDRVYLLVETGVWP
jgi:hypothetical protein